MKVKHKCELFFDFHNANQFRIKAIKNGPKQYFLRDIRSFGKFDKNL